MSHPELSPDTPAGSTPAPDYFINRELSLLEFNRRVLAQAQDPSVPLLERLRFLTICTANLDEFFEVRVAGLKQQLRFGAPPPGIDGVPASEVLTRISATAHELVDGQYRVANEEILPRLEATGIRLLKRARWNSRQKRWVREYFDESVKPVLTPIGLDPAHPFPMVANKGLCFLIRVSGEDAFKREGAVAVVQVPRSLPRVIAIPSEPDSATSDYVLLSSVIHANVGRLFPGMRVLNCHQFRVTRNSDLWVDEEEIENLMHALKGQLTRRSFGEAVRLEVASDMPEELCDFLRSEEGLREEDTYRVNGPVNLHRLAAIYNLIDRPDLKYRPFLPGASKPIEKSDDLFATIAKRSILLHHPYQSFAPVVELVRQAAKDPNVLAIKQTLYRTDAASPIVEALIEAAVAGKDVTALIELRARFDEAANITLAQRLEEVGANVVYGIVGYKAHAKMLLIVRREGDELRQYTHLGTGNYHTGTTRAYTDMGVLSVHKTIGRDVHDLFDQLTGLGKRTPLRRLVISPFTMHKKVIELIRDEIRAAKAGKPSGIKARMNSLSEARVIRALYEASQAGVPVDLVVRGICCLRPGVPGLSENIHVRSIVGRFLEHTRAWCFHAEGEQVVYLTSADWMSRNLHRRVETAFPIRTSRLKQRVIREGLDWYLRDNTQAWALQPDGSYVQLKPNEGEEPFCAQQALLERWTK